MARQEVWYGVGMMGAGSLIGLAASASLVPSGQIPAAFWCITVVVLVGTGVSLATAARLWWHGRRMASAPALDLVFGGDGGGTARRPLVGTGPQFVGAHQ